MKQEDTDEEINRPTALCTVIRIRRKCAYITQLLCCIEAMKDTGQEI